MPPCPMCRFDSGAKVVATWVLRVQSYCPTLNSIGTNSKNNHKYRGWRKAWEVEFGPWLKSLPPATRYRRVTITRLYGKGKRAFDAANFSGGCKPLLDTLTNFGALYDDSDLWCEAHYLQERSPDGTDYVEVKIEELE
jgi:hypothetical protein